MNKRNKEKDKLYSAQYYKNNKKSVIKRQIIYNKKKYATDPLIKIKARIRRNNAAVANFIKYCDFDFSKFKQHIENQFKTGMNWNNYGEWHLDHIVPLSIAKTEEKLNTLGHYTNLQPLWAIDNLKKGQSISTK